MASEGIPARLVPKLVQQFEKDGRPKKHAGSYVVRTLGSGATPDSRPPSSIPLIIPDDMAYDKETNTLKKIEGRERSKLVPVPEALDLLKQLQHKKIAVLAICGPCRSGKSYVLSKMLDTPDAFKLGHLMDPETFGIWLGTSYLDFGDYAMLLLDSEGIDAVSATGKNDVGILVMTVLLSSFLIYNSMQVPKRGDLEMMGCFTQLAKAITVNSQPSGRQGKIKPAACRKSFPNFLWLLRDVILEVPKHQTPQQYIMADVLTKNKAVGEAIMTLFPSFDCKLLPPPSCKGEVLRHIEKHESELEAQFKHGVIGLLEYLRENVDVKRGFSHGQRVDGPTLAMLLEQYLEAINTPGVIPCLENTWNSVVEMRCNQVINELVKEYESEMTTKLPKELPVEEEVTPEEKSDPDQHQKQVFLMEVHSEILEKVEEKLMKETRYVTPTKNAHKPDAAAQYKKELIQRLKSMIIETASDKIKGQIVTGGVLLRFIRDNYEKSSEYCRKHFVELSAPIWGKLQSISTHTGSETAKPDAPGELYTFQQFMDDRADLHLEYFRKAIGPAKQDVWETNLKGLKEWETAVKALDGYQNEVYELYQKLATSADKTKEQTDLVNEVVARSSRLEKEMEHLEVRLKQEHQENLKQVTADANKRMDQERAKVTSLEQQQKIQATHLMETKEEVRKLQQDKERAEQAVRQGETNAIVQLQAAHNTVRQQLTDLQTTQTQERAKHDKKTLELEKELAKPHTDKARNLKDEDYSMITRAWFYPVNKNPSVDDIKKECEARKLKSKLGWFTFGNTLENWLIHFGNQAVKHALVSLKRHSALSKGDVECHW